MSRRSFFEVASVLFGVCFIVHAFASLPWLMTYPRLGEHAGLRQFLILLQPLRYVIAGLCLISKRTTLACWLFPNEEQDAKSSKPSIRGSHCFEIGAKLLGLYFFVRSLTPAVELLIDLKQKGRDGLEPRSALATVLVLGVSFTLLLKSAWLAGMLYADGTNDTLEPTPAGSEMPQVSDSTDEPRDGESR
jgi:hypothetical protein